VTYYADEILSVNNSSSPGKSSVASVEKGKNAEDFLKEKKYEEGIRYYHQIIQKDPQKQLVYIGLGIFYYRMGQYDEALKALEGAKGLKAESFYFWIYRALSYKALGRVAEAGESFSQAVGILKEKDSFKTCALLDALQAFSGIK
jgi:tetratricopeptide (TPR) repeat protein